MLHRAYENRRVLSTAALFHIIFAFHYAECIFGYSDVVCRATGQCEATTYCQLPTLKVPGSVVDMISGTKHDDSLKL